MPKTASNIYYTYTHVYSQQVFCCFQHYVQDLKYIIDTCQLEVRVKIQSFPATFLGTEALIIKHHKLQLLQYGQCQLKTCFWSPACMLFRRLCVLTIIAIGNARACSLQLPRLMLSRKCSNCTGYAGVKMITACLGEL